MLFSPAFTISPQDVWAWERDMALGRRDDHPGFRPHFEQPVAGARVPDGLVMSKILDALARSGNLGGCQVERTSAGRLRTLAPIVVGESLTAVASVRYRSRRVGDPRTFVTLAVELRSGLRKFAEAEVGVEILAPEDPMGLNQAA
ncbi:hypothetical protein PPSIR1_03783 [Plesiocystis pacifica SIR-1]|uniref:Uncharacterized protein n=2 Tax=Plesiocystis pacifica TaxID=191768 RepID=A6G4B5_9BACT|nr:hypothetical protein PPSIR1_03783 [Plesiocystis pacifica SIR-1]